MEYLEGRGGQYIDTGLKLDSECEVETIFYSSRQSSNPIYGARKQVSPAVDNFILFQRLDDNGEYQRFSPQFDSAQFNNLQTYYSGFVKSTFNKNGLYVNDMAIDTWNASPFEGNYVFYIFTFNEHGSPDSRYCYGKMKYLKIRKNNSLIRYFIPCYRKTDNKPGMYDIVGGEFYTNANTSATQDFIVGADIR